MLNIYKNKYINYENLLDKNNFLNACIYYLIDKFKITPKKLLKIKFVKFLDNNKIEILFKDKKYKIRVNSIVHLIISKNIQNNVLIFSKNDFSNYLNKITGLNVKEFIKSLKEFRTNISWKYTDINEFKNSTVDFPYKKFNYNETKILKMFDNLTKYNVFSNNYLLYDTYFKVKNTTINTNDLLFIGRPTLIINLLEDYERYDIVSDMFIEEERMKCRIMKLPSPYEFFKKNIEMLGKKTLEEYKIITPINLREIIWKNTKECTTFRPINLIAIFQILHNLNNKNTDYDEFSILDPSSGWGDRLVGAMALNNIKSKYKYKKIKYLGVDPNSNLHYSYNNMINVLDITNKDNYKLICSPFETLDLGNQMFDLVFTSPPYFDLEVYTDDPKQSIAGKNNHLTWFNLFLKKYLSNAWNHLNNDRFMVIIINQKHGQENYVELMINYMYEEFKTCYYFGVIGYSNKTISNPQPCFVWKKSLSIPRELYNPLTVIKEFEHDNKKMYVIADDLLIGGTKQRAAIPFLNDLINKYNEFIYAGPVYGFGQIALSYACYLYRCKCTLFVEKRDKLYQLTERAKSYGAKVMEVTSSKSVNYTPLLEVQNAAKEYVKNTDKSYLIPFGFESDEFINYYVDALKESFPPDKINLIKRLWLVSGSSVLLRALTIFFPNVHFLIVQVGKNIWKEHVDWSRSTLYIAPEKFSDIAIRQPPYPSVKTYDAKLWQFVEQYGKDGDYIWNVGRDLSL